MRRDWKLRCGALLALLLTTAACGGGTGTTTIPDGPVTVNVAVASAAVERCNTYRALASVQQVGLDLDLSLGCQAHARYLALNDIDLRYVQLDAHNEDPQLPGYTAYGEQAGQSSVIYQSVTPVEAIDNWMRTFYHRLGLLNPNLYYVGFGSAAEYQVMDVVRGRVQGPYAVEGVVLYPPPGMTAVPLEYKTEIPHPIPGDLSLGTPITVEFFGGTGTHIELQQAALFDTHSGSQINCYLQQPGQHFLPGWDFAGVIALIPREPLPARRTLRVLVSGYVNGSDWTAEWTFTTQ